MTGPRLAISAAPARIEMLSISSGLKLSSRASNISTPTRITPAQRAKNTTSRMVFRKLDTEPGPKARIAALRESEAARLGDQALRHHGHGGNGRHKHDRGHQNPIHRTHHRAKHIGLQSHCATQHFVAPS